MSNDNGIIIGRQLVDPVLRNALFVNDWFIRLVNAVKQAGPADEETRHKVNVCVAELQKQGFTEAQVIAAMEKVE